MLAPGLPRQARVLWQSSNLSQASVLDPLYADVYVWSRNLSAEDRMPAVRKLSLPAARELAEQIRSLYARGLQEAELWQRIAGAMRKMLMDPALRQAAQRWPGTVAGTSVGNLLLYEDPDHGFVFNATVREPNCIGSVHDHGPTWTLYGLIEGRETMCRYERVDEASGSPRARLDLVDRRVIGPCDIDIVPPESIHQELAGEDRSIAFIVRARRPGTFPQHRYDLATGAVSITRGPQQILEPL